MLQSQLFPRSIAMVDPLREVHDCFREVYDEINSEHSNISSNDVLAILRPYFERIGFVVETGKSDDAKISVPVLFGVNNRIDKSFYADALSGDGKIVVEIEAGRATENNQFLKDIFEASMMFGVEYLVLGVRNQYRGHNDFERVYTFLETLYISNRITLPLKGIMLVGY